MKKMKTKQPSFFEEPELLKGNSCSFFSIIFVLIFMLIATIIGLFYVKVASGGFSFNIPLYKYNKSEQLKPINERISNLKTDERVEIRLEETELTTLVQAIPDFPLKKPQAKITPENIMLSGKTSNNFLSLNVQVYIKPIIKDNNLLWEVGSIKTGDVVAPQQLSDRISKALVPENFLPGGDQVVVERADLFDGYLLVVGIRK